MPYLSPSLGRTDTHLSRCTANVTSMANSTHEREAAPDIWSTSKCELDEAPESDSDPTLSPATQKERDDIARRMSVLFREQMQECTNNNTPFLPVKARVQKNKPETAREGKKVSVRGDQKYAVITEAPNSDRGTRYRSRRRRGHNHRPTSDINGAASSGSKTVSRVSKTQRENTKLSARERHRGGDMEKSESKRVVKLKKSFMKASENVDESKIHSMQLVLGGDISRDKVAHFLACADGDVEKALDLYLSKEEELDDGSHQCSDVEEGEPIFEVRVPTRGAKTKGNGKANKPNAVVRKEVDHFQLESQHCCAYQVGSRVDILDEYKSPTTGKVSKQWRKAKIVDSLFDDIYVHFDGYDKKYNAWINTVHEKERIAELGMHTGAKPTIKSETSSLFEEFEVGQEVMVKDIFRSLRTTHVSHKWRKAHITDLDYDPDLFIVKRYRIHFTGWNANRDIWIGAGESDSRIMSMARYKDTNEDTMSLRRVDQTAAEEQRKRREKREQAVSTSVSAKQKPRFTEQALFGPNMDEDDLRLPWHDPEEEFLRMFENDEDERATESSWRNFKVGKFYDVSDHRNHWYEAEVVELRYSPTDSDKIETVKMHILFSDDKEEDQWYERNSSRIEPHMSRIYLPGVELVNGHRIDVLNQTSYETSSWCSATVIESDRSTVKVHFDGHSQFFDERIQRTSQRIMPYGHKSKTSSKDFQKVVAFHYNSNNPTPLPLENTLIVSSRSPIQHPAGLSLEQPVAVALVDDGRNTDRSEDDHDGGLIDHLLSILEEIKPQITTARGTTIPVLLEKLELVDLQALELNLGAEWKEKLTTVTSEMRAALASRQRQEREATLPSPSAPRLDFDRLYEENQCNSAAEEHCSEPTSLVPLSETDSRWVPDNAYKHCMECEVEFGIFGRRHHCRYCGRLLCNQCSQHLIDSLRSCEACFITLRSRNQSAIQVPQQPEHTINSADGSPGLPTPPVTPMASVPVVVCAIVAEGDLHVQDMPLAEAIPVDAGSMGGQTSVIPFPPDM